MARPKKKPAKKKPPARRNPTPVKGPTWERAFLACFRDTANVRLSCEAASIDRSTVYDRRKADAAFAAAWEAAKDDAADRLEEEARRRASDGWDEPAFGSGGAGVGTVEVGTVRRYDHTLLIFLLKGMRPEKYRENHKVDHSGALTQTVIYLPQKNAAPAS